MKSEKRFKRLCLLAEALMIEEEDFRQQDRDYETQFKSDFASERAFLSQKSIMSGSGNKNQRFPKLKEPKVTEQSLKRLHRALARKTHPDLPHIADDKEFRSIQTAYEEVNVSSLLSAAVKHDIQISLDENDADQLERQIQEQSMRLKAKRSSLWWVWCMSDKSSTVRKQIYSVMGIDRSEFETWFDKTLPEGI
tara:strand:+ start:165 stop:746 length:582 start_codon:yes stop_codon:yes gene_type:complete